MKLYELAGVKKFASMNHEQVIQYLETNLGKGKFKLLGKGWFGYAVMIGADVYKFWMVDSGYHDFVEYCLKDQSNPYLPVFKSKIKTMPAFFLKNEGAKDKVFYVKMEMLKPVPSNFTLSQPYMIGLGDKDVKLHNWNDDDDWTDKEKERGYKHPKTYKGAKRVFDLDYEGVLEAINHTSSVLELCENLTAGYEIVITPKTINPVAKALMEQLILMKKNIKQRKGHWIDISPDNTMMRGDQIVLTDPIANQEDSVLAKKIVHIATEAGL